MGTRLYPRTRNVESLEKLAGVPAGTAARLDAMKLRHDKELEGLDRAQRYEKEYAQYCERNDDKHVGDYDAFLTFGWGKFEDPCGVAPGYSGRLEDPAKVTQLFRANGIGPLTKEGMAQFVALCEGVFWC